MAEKKLFLIAQVKIPYSELEKSNNNKFTKSKNINQMYKVDLIVFYWAKVQEKNKIKPYNFSFIKAKQLKIVI